MSSATMTWTILTGAKATEGSIKYWVNHELVPAAQVLEEAQAEIYTRLRVREMQMSVAVSASEGDSTIALPAGFQSAIRLDIDGLGPLPLRRQDTFPLLRDEDGALPTGTPTCWTFLGSDIMLDTILDEDLSGTLWYYGTPEFLSVDLGTNFLTDRFPSLFRQAILVKAWASRNRADMSATAALMYEQQLSLANVTLDDARRGEAA